MPQVLVIHGGEVFENHEMYLNFLENLELDLSRSKAGQKKWKNSLADRLGSEYEVYLSQMPNEMNAQYSEWKMMMDKYIDALQDGIVLIGHSLGGSFLVKYLSENKINKRVKGLFLVSACFEKDVFGYGLYSFALPEEVNLEVEKVFLYHSKDDPVVPFSDLESFKKVIPNGVSRVFEDRKHFNTEEFPELVEDIKSLG